MCTLLAASQARTLRTWFANVWMMPRYIHTFIYTCFRCRGTQSSPRGRVALHTRFADVRLCILLLSVSTFERTAVCGDCCCRANGRSWLLWVFWVCLCRGGCSVHSSPFSLCHVFASLRTRVGLAKPSRSARKVQRKISPCCREI